MVEADGIANQLAKFDLNVNVAASVATLIGASFKYDEMSKVLDSKELEAEIKTAALEHA